MFKFCICLFIVSSLLATSSCGGSSDIEKSKSRGGNMSGNLKNNSSTNLQIRRDVYKAIDKGIVLTVT